MKYTKGFGLIIILIAVAIIGILAVSLRGKDNDSTVPTTADNVIDTYERPSIQNSGSITAPIKKAEDIMDILKQRDQNFLNY